MPVNTNCSVFEIACFIHNLRESQQLSPIETAILARQCLNFLSTSFKPHACLKKSVHSVSLFKVIQKSIFKFFILVPTFLICPYQNENSFFKHHSCAYFIFPGVRVTIFMVQVNAISLPPSFSQDLAIFFNIAAGFSR